jgi:hypothetical protein
MVLYNLYLVLINETNKVYDNAIQSIVYEKNNSPYFLINLN